MQLSYWERNTFFSNIDIGIIGGGIIGMCTALYIKQVRPRLKIAIFERGTLPYGASTRNAGFACIGSLGELLDDITKEHIEAVLHRVMMRYEGLIKLRTLIGDTQMDYRHWGGYEIFTERNMEEYNHCMSAMKLWNDLLYTITGYKETFSAADNVIASSGFRGVSHVIKNHAEGQLDTGMLILSLIRRCQNMDIHIYNGITISHIENNADHVTIHTGSYNMSCSSVVICNNAFAKQFVTDLDVIPARAQVIITSPIKDLQVNGSFHYHQGYYYFRNIHNRILLGGGRNLDIKGESTSDFGTTPLITDNLRDLLRQTILPNSVYTIEQEWSGIMAMGSIKSPIIKKVNDNLFIAVRMGGMGIAIGAMVANEVSNMVIENF